MPLSDPKFTCFGLSLWQLEKYALGKMSGSRILKLRFDIGPEGNVAAFAAPVRLIEAYDIDDVAEVLAVMEKARQEGFWLAGFASYEAGYALEPRLRSIIPTARNVPLLRFGVYESWSRAPSLVSSEAQIEALSPRWSADDYRAAFDRLRSYIASGDIYQANLTFPIDATATGGAEAIYAALSAKQPVGHGALVECADFDILSRSPELFFRVSKDGRIETRPMKGTMPRGASASEDQANKEFLRSDAKNRAENLMIVDLLRNDLSRMCEVGSVEVPELFRVETYETVHQMTSLVAGQSRSGVTIPEIFQALFPCGSITGAPKLRSMEIIRELEPWARDVYCGSIGWIAPDGRADFNVAIRSILLQGEKATLNVGGGVVWDSTAASEYEEALWKARFARLSPPIPA